jgi:hypothetical protein
MGIKKKTMKKVKFKHKSGVILTGVVESSFIYKKTMQEYLVVNCDNKKYSVNPKNIINESND